MNQEYIEFGNSLKCHREARALSLEDVARITKIPPGSLLNLEAGRFDALPAEVFVRGFLRSYARCIGLDPEETVRGYGELSAQKKAEEAVAEPDPPSAPARVAAAMEEVGTAPRDEALPAVPPAARPERQSPTERLRSVTRTLSEAGQGGRPMPLTLAVIILVIVATLTLSLLLRRPSASTDGVTQTDHAAERLL